MPIDGLLPLDGQDGLIIGAGRKLPGPCPTVPVRSAAHYGHSVRAPPRGLREGEREREIKAPPVTSHDTAT